MKTLTTTEYHCIAGDCSSSTKSGKKKIFVEHSEKSERQMLLHNYIFATCVDHRMYLCPF